MTDKNPRIVKGKIIHDHIHQWMQANGILENEDLIYIKLEKVEGSPIEWLQKKGNESGGEDTEITLICQGCQKTILEVTSIKVKDDFYVYCKSCQKERTAPEPNVPPPKEDRNCPRCHLIPIIFEDGEQTCNHCGADMEDTLPKDIEAPTGTSNPSQVRDICAGEDDWECGDCKSDCKVGRVKCIRGNLRKLKSCDTCKYDTIHDHCQHPLVLGAIKKNKWGSMCNTDDEAYRYWEAVAQTDNHTLPTLPKAPEVQGEEKYPCRICKGTGKITKFLYDLTDRSLRIPNGIFDDDGSEREPGPSNGRSCETCGWCDLMEEQRDPVNKTCWKEKTPNTLPRPSNKKEQEVK